MRTWRMICLALGGLRRTPLRVALTCLGVTIACGALVSMVGFALGFQLQAETPFEKLGLLNNIEVSLPKDEPSDDPPLLDDQALDRMGALPGVTLAYPDFRVSDVQITRGEHTQTALAVGLPRETGLLGLMDDVLVAGDFFSAGDQPQAVVGQRLTRDLGFDSPDDAVGAAVTLEVTGLSPDDDADFTFQRRKLTVTIVGVSAFPRMGPRFLPRGVLLPIELMKDLPGTRFSAAMDRLRAGQEGGPIGYRKAVVRVGHPRDLARVEQEIQAMGFRTRTLLGRLEEMRTFFVFLDVLLAAVGTVALVVAGLGIVNTLLMSVLERYQEIGIYKAIGASDGDLLVLFLTEASIIGFVGGLGGLALGRAVSWLLQIAVNNYARSQGVTADLSLFAFPLWLLLGAVLFSITIAVLAGVYPALRAARVDPIRALRAE
jgi:putative ABC transport system permease protein